MTQTETKSWVDYIDRIDNKIIYTVLIIIGVLTAVLTIEMPIIITPAAQAAYDLLEAVPADSIVLVQWRIGAAWYWAMAPGSAAMMQHMHNKGVQMVILAGNAPQLMDKLYNVDKLVTPLAGQTYGTDYVLIGAIPETASGFQRYVRDPYGSVSTDYYGTPIPDLPLMQRVRDLGDFANVFEVIISCDTSEARARNALQQFGPTGVPLIMLQAAATAPMLTPYVSSGQISGFLVDAAGAAQYEKLMGVPGWSTKVTSFLNLAHMFLVVLIGLGNIGYIIRRQRRNN